MEREVKLRLDSARAYRRVCNGLPEFLEEVEQHNSYWDLPDHRLRARRQLLRIRREGERAWITRKGAPEQATGGLFSVAEDEETLDVDVARRIEDGRLPLESLPSAVLERLRGDVGEISGLRCWGRVRNLRRRYRLTADLVAEVDRTEFPDGAVEWEIEVESEDLERAREAIVETLDHLGVSHRPQTRTKSERLLEHME